MSDLLSKCTVCGALLDEEDLFCANCGTEAPVAAGEGQSAAALAPPSHVATHNFTCRGCGASMSYDASAGTLRCPFCGSEQLDKKADAQEIDADAVVPFAITREAAEASLRQWLGRGFWRPGDLVAQALVVNMTPVYVPYWVFQADTHTYWTADTDRTPATAHANWYPMSGEHSGRYEGVLVGASSALTPGETSALCPFELAAAVPPEQIDLQNVTYERFSVPRKYARPLARQGFETQEAVACQQYVPGKCRNMKVSVRITNLTSRPMLLPVWIMAYRYRDRVFRFLVNGQTGRSTGEAPVSLRKIATAVAVAVLVVALVLLFALWANADEYRHGTVQMPCQPAASLPADAPEMSCRRNTG